MFKFLLLILFIGLLATGLHIALVYFQSNIDWWACAFAAFLGCAIVKVRSLTSFWASFFAIFLVWAGYAYWLDTMSNSILAKKMIGLVHLPSPMVLILVTGLIGGAVGGMAGMTGSFFRKMIFGED